MAKFLQKYYSLDKIKAYDADYNLIIGERSNGKTYSVLEEILKHVTKTKRKAGIIRRYREDYKGKRGPSLFSAHVANGLVEKYTNGDWDGVYYYSNRWYFSRTYEDDKGNVQTEKAEEPFCYAFALSDVEHDKSTSFPDIDIILFDEFIGRHYLTDEFVLLMNELSTIIRQRDDVKIYMCGNTISHFSPYFQEMGLKHIKRMQQGTIDLYTYGDCLRVAVEYCSPSGRVKKSNKYFAFDNPKLKMITNGAFELEIYPHLRVKYRPKDIVYTYFITHEQEVVQCEIVTVNNTLFTYIHRKTTELQEKETDLIYGDVIPDSFYKRPNIYSYDDKITKKILQFYRLGQVFYQDNEIGELVTNYFETCYGNMKK